MGPRGDGSIPAAALRRLREIGAWTSINRDAIYGTRPATTAAEPAWGRVVRSGPRVFLYVYDLPPDHALPLPDGLPAFASARVLETDEPLAVNGRSVTVGKLLPDDRVTVIEMG